MWMQKGLHRTMQVYKSKLVLYSTLLLCKELFSAIKIVQAIYDKKQPNLELIPTKEISIDFGRLDISLQHIKSPTKSYTATFRKSELFRGL